MRTWLAGFTLVLATSAARSVAATPAELAVGDLQLELAPRRDLLSDEGAGGTEADAYYRFAGFAQLTGGGHGTGDVAAGASAAVAGIGCDVVAGRAQGRLRFDGSYAGEAHYAVCLSRALLTVVFDGRRGSGLEPALDARRSLWAQRYDDTYDRAEIGFGELWGDDQHRHTIFKMALGHGTTHQGARRRSTSTSRSTAIATSVTRTSSSTRSC